ncbi:PH domain-containing protein [Nocardioides limicola]|uniref:PH domain-containing protein n=1 Tax=Nocardioides limicola TaxID=2803368 RepID=UPI00193C8310|nr:PH domain-containing protein [Nocardioides sp. DJM-14]
MNEPDWRQLDPRMLILGPIAALKQLAVPAVIALIASGLQNAAWMLFALPVVVTMMFLLGAMPWFTTRYRITESNLQRRQGLLSRKVVTAPLDRIRTVDLSSPLLHRILGLTKVEIGTGVDDTRIELDPLGVDEAAELRRVLLARRAVARGESPVAEPVDPATSEGGAGDLGDGAPETSIAAATPAHVEVASIDWSWLRFAPFSLTRLVIVAGIFGLLSQFADDLPFLDADNIRRGWGWLLEQALPLVLVTAFFGSLALWLLISIGGYVTQWWRFRLFRDDGNLRLTAGLITTRSTSIEEARIRGVQMSEWALLRLVGGAQLSTLTTGLESGTTSVLPPSPVGVNRRVAATLIEAPEPMTVRLTRHGPRARRRCHIRNQWSTVFITLGVVAAWQWWEAEAWMIGATALLVGTWGAVLGEAEYRHLGHALVNGHLVSGWGALSRHRVALQTDGIIGWVITQNIFQRRLGLASLIATTAAGSERVLVRDVDRGVAVTLAAAATPDLIAEFRV